MTVLNLETYGYSQKAVQLWLAAGWSYATSSWDEVGHNVYHDVTALIVRLKKKVAALELDLFPNLKYLLTATTGLDHVDLDELKQRNITLISLRGEVDFLKTIPSTAEHTWALCLALVRNIPFSMDDVREGKWDRDSFRGFQLKNKQLGLIGLGRTGMKVASYASAFDMKVVYYDPYVSTSLYNKYSDLSVMLEESDIVSIHVHLTAETENMLDANSLSKIKSGAFLINTSRGRVWNEQAVYDALSRGRLGGIATDVLATELDDIKSSVLWKAMQEGKQVIVTPHIGGATWDAMWTCEEFIVKKTLAKHHGC